MISTTNNEIRVELKYCERCGGLWFRPQHSPQVFCIPCTQRTRDALQPQPASISVKAQDFSPAFASPCLAESRRDACISGGAA
jgi:Zn-finger nucleic acid-binding protein